MKTAMQELIDMMNESVKQYSDNAQQEAVFFALIEEAKKQLPKEKQQRVIDFEAGMSFERNTWKYSIEKNDEIKENHFNQ